MPMLKVTGYSFAYGKGRAFFKYSLQGGGWSDWLSIPMADLTGLGAVFATGNVYFNSDPNSQMFVGGSNLNIAIAGITPQEFRIAKSIKRLNVATTKTSNKTKRPQQSSLKSSKKR